MTASVPRYVALVAIVLATAVAMAALPLTPPAQAASTGWFSSSVADFSDATLTVLASGQVDRALRERAAAVREDSTRRFVVGTAFRERSSQRQAFRWLQAVPFVRYQVTARAVPTAAEVRRGTLDESVRLVYRLPGDTLSTVREVSVGFQRRGAQWWLRSWRPQRADLWDLGPVAVAESGPALVVGAADRYDPATLQGLADLTVSSLSAVDEVWPYGWSRRATVLAPADAETMAKLLGTTTEVDGLAGVTVGEQDGDRQALRVVLNPDYYPTMVPLARQILLRHEMTHVAQHGLELSGVPQWLTEGLAEHVGYAGSGVPTTYVAADLLAQVRTGKAPTRLPADADFAFDADRGDRSLAYRGGWTACKYIADTYSEPTLLRFYRAVAVADGTSSQRVATAGRRVLARTPAQLTAGWQTWLQAQA